ncbi:MAG: hypothetical protein R2695_19460 [Acidimicrobiales bacterium]
MDLRTDKLEGDDFEAAYAELCEVLAKLRDGFTARGPAVWVPRLERDIELLDRRQAYGLDRFLSHFGSMGSIGDIGVDADLDELLIRAHTLARALKRSLD